MIRSCSRRRFLLLSCAGLAACASPTLLRPTLVLSGPQAAFRAEGRLAIRQGQQGQYAHFSWLRQGEQDRIELGGPLGQTVASLLLRPGLAELTDQQGALHRAAEADQLARQLLGYPLPVAGLRHWLIGEADPAAAADWLDAEQLQQSGWRIQFEFPADGGQRLPHRLTLSRDELTVKLLVSDWRTAPPATP